MQILPRRAKCEGGSGERSSPLWVWTTTDAESSHPSPNQLTDGEKGRSLLDISAASPTIVISWLHSDLLLYLNYFQMY